ncbi:MAG: glycosyltransferase family 2 protein [Bacteroidales bacterium]|jgi:hypothetical protein|nr:glycosyltransferase family 2 protein [Bacteroidales bacterium]
MKLHIAIPALDELDFLPQTLVAIVQQQTLFPYKVYICVNQPEAWWIDPEKVEICENNQELLCFLEEVREIKGVRIEIIDKTSVGEGWPENKSGVGWARKTLFDEIIKTAADEDVIISLDADTLFNENYFQSIGENFTQNKIDILSVPYYHKLTDDENANRAILRYEIYLRNYFINMHRIGSPYTFTAIGSAMAVRVRALKKIRGISPLSSGEDFYLLQKLRKMSPISNYNIELVHPAARFSTRVPFGTGPAMINFLQGNEEAYPIYHHSLFAKIKETYDIIPALFTEDKSTEFIEFLKKQYKTDDLWGPLRKNFKTLTLFTRAFHEKADGLRILQFLKTKHNSRDAARYYSTDQLLKIRDSLFESEMNLRKLDAFIFRTPDSDIGTPKRMS